MDPFKRLDKSAKKCMRTGAIIALVIWTAVTMVLFLIFKDKLGGWDSIVLMILCGSYVLCILNAIVSPEIRYMRYRYCITEEKIHVVEGLWYIEETIAPIERIHQIEVSQGPIDRMFGLGKVGATTAGGEVTLRFLPKEQAEQLAENLQEQIRKTVRRQLDEEEME